MSLRNIKVGDRVKYIKDNESGFSGIIGNEYIVDSIKGDIIHTVANHKTNYVFVSEVELVPLTKEDLINAKEDLLLKISDIDMKIAFMSDNTLDTFDQDEFKVYKALTLIEDDKINKMDKVKLIKKLLK